MSQGAQSLSQEHNTMFPTGVQIHADPPRGELCNIVTTPSILQSTLFIPFSIIFPNFPEEKNQIVKHYVYSGTSGAASLQQFVEQNIYHRQGEMN